MKFVSTLSLMPLLFLSSIFSALSTCLTLGPETWRPSPWSRCSSIPHTTPESRGTSATPRPPPFGTMMPWRQTGTGSTPAKRPSRVASGPWRKTAWRETRRLLRPERRVMNCDTETRRERLVFRKNTQWMPCVHTLKRQYKQTLCACIAQVSKRIKAVLSCQPCLLPEEAQRTHRGRGWDEETGTRASRRLTKALFISHLPPLSMWRPLGLKKIQATHGRQLTSFAGCEKKITIEIYILFKENRCVLVEE